MKKGDLVIICDQETFPEWSDTYGIIIANHWKGDVRMCQVWWCGIEAPVTHYKHELHLITNKGIRYGKLILEGRQAPEREGN